MSATLDYWRVNSYGYPNPFSDQDRAIEAWETLLTFFDHSSYSRLKRFWESRSAPRALSAHAVESWKATFEEYGLLYVLSGTGDINITPAGAQFREAAESGNRDEFAWIGLSLLLRYPLRGPRRPKSPRHGISDLLLYWFLYAAVLELENYLWWSEFEHVLCTVFLVDEGREAVENIRLLRSGAVNLEAFPLPGDPSRGGFYNSLNQVIVHAGMNHMLLGNSQDDAFYVESGRERKHWVLREWLSTVELALGGKPVSIDCDGDANFLSRMPTAPDFAGDEEAYFNYLGAAVPPKPSTSDQSVAVVDFQGESVAVLREINDYTIQDNSTIVGSIAKLCKLARGQRVILGHDHRRSYVIQEKRRAGSNEVVIVVRRSRPITNIQPILSLLGDANG